MRSLSFAMILALAASTAHAGPHTERMSKCLQDAATQSERASLGRWIFAAVALHPDVRDMATVSVESRAELDRGAARIFERLILEACASEVRDAVRVEGRSAFDQSFGVLGGVAMQALLRSNDVIGGLEGVAAQLDERKLESVFGQ